MIACGFFLKSAGLFAAKIGLLIVATGRYISFVDPLIQSAETFFCKNHEVTYFVFTDSDRGSTDRIRYVYQKKLGWPFDTMMRYHMYLANQDFLIGQDYLFSCDADMLFKGVVGDEILEERVATQHPGFYKGGGTYETNPKSKACVFSNEGEYYFAGGFYGGATQEFLKIAKTNACNIDEDYRNGIIAVWHDESHWNRYCIDRKPTLILSPAYCYPESWHLPFEKKLIALDKNHSDMRKN